MFFDNTELGKFQINPQNDAIEKKERK